MIRRWNTVVILLLCLAVTQLLHYFTPITTVNKSFVNVKNIDVELSLQLRFDWTNLERISSYAKKIEVMQTDCSMPIQALFWHRHGAGLGSDIHVYSSALCYALEMKNVRVRSIADWEWRDEDHCRNIDGETLYDDVWKISPMTCYFPQSELLCPHDNDNYTDLITFDPVKTINLTDPDGTVYKDICVCQNVLQDAGNVSMIRAATTEYLFTRVSDLVQNEAQRQLHVVFANQTVIPTNLITVHIRWGDKHYETSLLPISKYIDAIQMIVQKRRISKSNKNDDDDDVNILLCTADPEALQQFMNAKPIHWNVFVDQYYNEMIPYRLQKGNVYNLNVITAIESHGRNGLVALGSLLVAMESNDYVLTTDSNWSRLINEIRINMIHPRCNGCTTLIDLSPGEY